MMMNRIDIAHIRGTTISILKVGKGMHNGKSLLDLPNEIISEIVKRLPLQDQLALAATSKGMNSKIYSSDCFYNGYIATRRRVSKEYSLWYSVDAINLFIKKYPDRYSEHRALVEKLKDFYQSELRARGVTLFYIPNNPIFARGPLSVQPYVFNMEKNFDLWCKNRD
ncbi:F-box protein [Yersinia kristensenii]|uniref:F-box protein n=3 Tax=Yersinia TaxID=629 RepID=UPI001C60E714|nr:F-box protein [Yersinia kristensenii]MBW5818042.1 F-box protein [Yersinia kristensenii]MBW5829806.1 F-box protein [Yersinia kristensenii]MBW5842200.1 F-box protein [Yersinia kristensenii]